MENAYCIFTCDLYITKYSLIFFFFLKGSTCNMVINYKSKQSEKLSEKSILLYFF